MWCLGDISIPFMLMWKIADVLLMSFIQSKWLAKRHYEFSLTLIELLVVFRHVRIHVLGWEAIHKPAA